MKRADVYALIDAERARQRIKWGRVHQWGYGDCSSAGVLPEVKSAVLTEECETVLSPFAGIGSEVYVAVKLGRRGLGCELKPSYWRTSVDNLRRFEAEITAPNLFDTLEVVP